MSDEIWQRNEPDSPCQNVCVIHPTAKLCIGCLRDIDEISGWTAMSKAERLAIIDDLPNRQPRLKGARRKRPMPRG